MLEEGTMLESLVSSRVRRTLLEYLVTHPQDRFYLRGLAKELNLSISPLRRELKRLEQLGLLKTYQEANLLFYLVDQQAPLFTQLKHALDPALKGRLYPSAPGGVPPAPVETVETAQPTLQRQGWVARRPERLPVVAVSMVSLVVLGILTYLTVTNQRLLALTQQMLSIPRSQVTVVETAPSTSGEMRSAEWRLLPGSVGGGFSSGAVEESY